MKVPTWPEHVSPSGRPPGNYSYAKEGCRCAGCKAGSSAVYYRRKADPEAHRRPKEKPRGRGCYNSGCSHPECAEANRTYSRERSRRSRSELRELRLVAAENGWFEDITDVG